MDQIWISLFMFVASSVGFTLFLVDSEVFKKFLATKWIGKVKDWIKKQLEREHVKKWLGDFYEKLDWFFSKMLSCYQCSGFWSGLFNGLIWIVPATASSWAGAFFQTISCGFAGSLLSMFYIGLINYIEARTIVNLGDGDGT